MKNPRFDNFIKKNQKLQRSIGKSLPQKKDMARIKGMIFKKFAI
jgi:hypothetical protein